MGRSTSEPMMLRIVMCGLVATAMTLPHVGCMTSGDSGWGMSSEVGPYPVGFKSTEIRRELPGGDTRSLALSMWYPAAASGGTSMTVQDLFRIVLAENQLTEADGLTIGRGLAAAMTGDPDALAPNRAHAALGASTLARLDAPPAEGRFPLVLWSVRHATALAQAPLAEVLASHGLAVATAWSSDPPLAFLWEDRSEAEKLATIESHTEDLMEVIRVLAEDSGVDNDRVIVASWSYGGQTAARLQEREDAVRAVISIDANVVPARQEERLDLRRPLIYFVGRDFAGRGFERLDELGAPWVAVRLPDMAHGNFNALEGYLPELFESQTVFDWSLGGEVALVGYRTLVRMVRETASAFRGDSVPTPAGLAGLLMSAAGSFPVEIHHSDSGA